MIIYPMVWTIYVWIYLELIQRTAIFVDMNTSKFVVVWIIIVMYFVIISFWFILLVFNRNPLNDGNIFTKIYVISFVWSVRKERWSINNAEQLFNRQDIVKCVLESESLGIDIALILLSYLY